MPSRMPEGHTPTAPGFTARFPASMQITFAQLGVQAPDRAAARASVERILELLGRRYGPQHVDRAWHRDPGGKVNEFLMCYWTAPEAYERWESDPAVAGWWRDVPLSGPIGHWRETAVIPRGRLETLHSAPRTDQGVGRFGALEQTSYHEYMGSMRDRIPNADADPFDVPATACFGSEHAPDESAQRRRVRVASPRNLCLIRSAQDLTECGPAQRETYREVLEPALKAAMAYVGGSPDETGCRSVRLVTEVDVRTGAELEKTCAVAWWDSLSHLERWTARHPTHHAIYKGLFELLGRHAYQLELMLWHEVAVLPEGAALFEYVNCAAGTGVLRGRSAAGAGPTPPALLANQS